MEWIKVTDRMPEEKEYFVGGNNYIDGKDRKWSESKQVLCVNDMGQYVVSSTKNGKFMAERYKDCDGFTHSIVAWIPIPEFNMDVEELWK